jgi:SAM-dependent methyltransferase
MSDYTEVKECRACGGTDTLKTYLDLTDQPLANSYHEYGEAALPKFPLKVNYCWRCYHSQLSVVVNPDLMFRNYLYVSGTSQTLRDYFDFFVDYTMELTGYGFSSAPVRVMDIACNDGSQLDAFKRNAAAITYGVDPAKNLVPEAVAKGHNVVCDYWNDGSAQSFDDKEFDILIAQNVFAHTHDALGFLKTCEKVMHDRSVLFIQTSQAKMIQNGEFDTMYHEHLSFFTIESMRALVERAGLALRHVEYTNIHGTSYVFSITRIEYDRDIEDNVDAMIAREQNEGLYSPRTYRKFATKAKECVDDLRETIDTLSSQGYMVVGYGAAAKGMTMLNFGKIHLDYIVDDNPLKVGRFTPGMDIAIRATSVIKDEEKLAIIPLAWNFFDEISNKVRSIRPDKHDIFIRYFPKLLITK